MSKGNTMNKRHLFAGILLGGALFLVGRMTAGDGAAMEHEHAPTGAQPAPAAGATVWTCPMHPQIKLPEPGDCPICGMDLVELTSAVDEHPRQLSMSAESRELAQIETTLVERRYVSRPVPMVGKIEIDETAMRSISAWVPGRLDRLFVDYTGVRVQKGDHMVSLYSPELRSAQEELLSTRARLKTTAGESSEFLADSNQRAYESAREKLILWGLTAEQVAEIEARGTAQDHVILTSPASGVVIDKKLEEGAYVQTGTKIYMIASLDHLWVQLDAYEQDLHWLRYGQEVVVQAEALPGERFEGRISFIDPLIDERTRTAKVRVNIENADGRLKPGMFVRAIAAARVGAEGAVLDRHLSGKWVSPMHPEIVKDGPGVCDVCGMDLVRAEDLGLVGVELGEVPQPLVVPASALLLTGRRAVAYVEVEGAERPTYEGREVELGPRAGDEYIVRSGLAEGERVVTRGAFRIDSSMQIRAKPSMMSMPAQQEEHEDPGLAAFRAALTPTYTALLALHQALAADEEATARSGLMQLKMAIDAVDAGTLSADARSAWSRESARMRAALGAAGQDGDVDALRASFARVSTAGLGLLEVFGQAGAETLREAYCPMAFDSAGASWLQVGEVIANPYYGAKMQRCGEFRRDFPSSAEVSHEGLDPSGEQPPPALEDVAPTDEHSGHGH